MHRACADRTQPWALATLVRTEGSTYRKPGARMLIDCGGQTIGVLSGGCLEETVARHGLDVLRDGKAQLLNFDTRLLHGCNGHLEILVERLPAANEVGNLLTKLASSVQRREACRIRTRFEGAEPLGSVLLSSHELASESHGTFIHHVPLPNRVIVFGTGPELDPILNLGATLGWIVLPISHPSQLPEDVIADDQTAAVVMTHHFGRDMDALNRVIAMRLPYIGLLGPRRRYSELVAGLQDLWASDPDLLAPIHAPAGLDTGSESPEEIALSIVAEIAAVLAGRSAGFLRDRAPSDQRGKMVANIQAA